LFPLASFVVVEVSTDYVNRNNSIYLRPNTFFSPEQKLTLTPLSTPYLKWFGELSSVVAKPQGIEVVQLFTGDSRKRTITAPESKPHTKNNLGNPI